MIRLSREQVILLHNEVISETGGSAGIRDEGLLDSAINAPFQTFGGSDVYPTVQQKAARLGYSLANNHAFVDGNKRVGANAMCVFLALNGFFLEYTQDELYSLFLGIAASEISFEQLAGWVEERCISPSGLVRHENDR